VECSNFQLIDSWLEGPYLAFHRVCIDLTHVLAPVLLLNVSDVQIPDRLTVVRYSYPMVVCYDMYMYSLYGFSVRFDPADLQIGIKFIINFLNVLLPNIRNTLVIYRTKYLLIFSGNTIELNR
jgi:hypothetical protein